MALTRESLMQFMGSKLGVDTAGIDDQTSLFSSGMVDSFSMIDLLAFVEREGGFKLGASEVSLENLDSVERILAMAHRKASGAK